MDAKLSRWQRLGVRIHLLYCVWCRRYAAQLRFMRRAASQLPNPPQTPESVKLPDEAREKIRQRLLEEQKIENAKHSSED